MSLIAYLLSASVAAAHPASVVPVDVSATKIIDCSAAVDEVLSKTQGRLLSVRPHADRCTVTILVSRQGERPQKIIFRMAHDEDSSTDQ
ncbi:MAG: hypothetical protein KGI75_22240 [Rhizobiaceae bacterium]|nr:hypothetical protein [Rhizobiaceae bacterium]